MGENVNANDGEDSADELEIDIRIRAELGRAIPGEPRPTQVLEAMSPKLIRARRYHQGRQAALGIAAGTLLFFGVAAVLRNPALNDQATTVAGQPEATDESTTDPTPDALEVDVPDEEADSSDGPGLSDDPTPESASTVPPSTEAAVPTTELTLEDDQEALESDCGTVIVEVDGEDVELVEVRAKSGFSYEVDSSGPEEIKVSFRQGSTECKIKAKVEDDGLDIEIE